MFVSAGSRWQVLKVHSLEWIHGERLDYEPICVHSLLNQVNALQVSTPFIFKGRDVWFFSQSFLQESRGEECRQIQQVCETIRVTEDVAPFNTQPCTARTTDVVS